MSGGRSSGLPVNSRVGATAADPAAGHGWRPLPQPAGCADGSDAGGLAACPCVGIAAGLAGIGDHLPLPSLLGSAGAAAATGAVGPATLGPPLAVVGTVVGTLAAADDRPGPGGRSAGAALAVQFDHDLG